MSSNKSTCPLCDKTYTRVASLKKHMVCCEFLNKSKKEKQIDQEEHENMPTYKELVAIVQEFALKVKSLEQKLEVMEKWVDVKKKKINVIQWLNTNVVPSKSFTTWAIDIDVTQKHLKHLFENTIIDTITLIFQENTKEPPPMYSFEQKQHLFYIYIDEWKEMIFSDMAFLLKKIQIKLLHELSVWREENINQLNANDKMSENYNKIVIKLMNIPFDQDQIYHKIKSNMYNTIKIDIKNMIEYEFEF